MIVRAWKDTVRISEAVASSGMFGSTKTIKMYWSIVSHTLKLDKIHIWKMYVWQRIYLYYNELNIFNQSVNGTKRICSQLVKVTKNAQSLLAFNHYMAYNWLSSLRSCEVHRGSFGISCRFSYICHICWNRPIFNHFYVCGNTQLHIYGLARDCSNSTGVPAVSLTLSHIKFLIQTNTIDLATNHTMPTATTCDDPECISRYQ